MKTKIFYDFEATNVSRDADMISVGLVAVTLYRNSLCAPNEINNEYRVKTFYAELNDFSLEKCGDWVKENIVGKLQLDYLKSNLISDVPINGVDDITDKNNIKLLGTSSHISKHLKEWLSQFEDIEFWADFDVIDKPMLIDLIADWNQQKDYTLHNKVYEDCKDVIELIANHNSDKTLVEDFVSFYPPKTNFIRYNKIGLPEHLPNIKYDQFFDLHTLFKINGIDTDISREEFSEVRKQVIPLPFSDCSKAHNALYDSWICYLCYKKLNTL
ncbi:MAG: hypothetical protein ACRCXN_12290 [Bacteroidales bacterium]